MIVCSCHVTYESTLYSCLNVKELLVRSRREIWSLSDCNWNCTQNHLVRKRTLNHLAKRTLGGVFVYELSGSGFGSSCSPEKRYKTWFTSDMSCMGMHGFIIITTIRHLSYTCKKGLELHKMLYWKFMIFLFLLRPHPMFLFILSVHLKIDVFVPQREFFISKIYLY